MSNDVTNPVIGRAFVEFSLQLPSQVKAHEQIIPLDNCKITESVFTYNETELNFQTTNPQFANQVLKAIDDNGNPLINWRIGIGDRAILWLPWQLHYVVRYKAAFEGVGPAAGHTISIITRDLLHLIDRSSKTRAHRGTISSIIQNIALSSNLTNLVIEATQGVGIWIQSYEGDFEFIRKRLIARARSQRGRGNYYLFIRDNVVHFHTLEYQTAVNTFNYYVSSGSRLEAIDVAQGKLEVGAAGAQVVYHDPYTGDSRAVTSDPAKAIRLANTIPRLDKVLGAQRNIREHRTQIRDEEAGSAALAQNAYEFARSECFQLKLQSSMMPFVRPGELLRIIIDPNAGNTSIWSGLYLVGKAQHTVKKGELTSVYVLQRGEQSAARNSSANDTSNLQSEQVAPGYDINVREAQASNLTKGAGNNASDGTFLTVQDKNAAPVAPAGTGSVLKAVTG